MTARRRLSLLLAIAAFALASCGVGLFGPSGGPYPEACEDLGFPARQCASMVRKATSQLGVYPPIEASSIDILPPTHDGRMRLSAYMISRVRFHLASGAERTEEIWCIGVLNEGDEPCDPDPRISIAAGRVGRDVPCTGGGDPPTGCATLPPTPRPESQALASPLRVPVLDIPLDHLGPYQVEVGEAGLPDGAFTASSASLVDERPQSFWIRNARVAIEPIDPARPPVGSIYREPFDGVERVLVTLEFDVTEFSPGAVLQVRDIVVE